MFKRLRDFSKKFAGSYRVWAGHKGTLHITTPEDAEVIKKNIVSQK